MLDVAGAPKIESKIVSDIRLRTGTMWHSYIEGLLHATGIKFRSEVKLDQWMPEGWSGTADWIFEQNGISALGDLKTIKGEGIRWIQQGGAKEEHIWQLSAYWHALADSGLPLLEEFGIFYLPMNDVQRETVEPVLQVCSPLDRSLVIGRMEERWALTQDYLVSMRRPMPQYGETATLPLPRPYSERFLTDKLAPVQPREQKLAWVAKTGVFEVKLSPHRSCAYCPFPDDLCDCSTQGVTKVGEYDLDGNYTPRAGYENVIPLVEPNEDEIKRKRAA